MPYIRQVEDDDDSDASVEARRELDIARKRAGRVWNIVHIMSLNPRVMKASMDQYGAIMHGRSPLSRRQREMLATVVAAERGCRY